MWKRRALFAVLLLSLAVTSQAQEELQKLVERIEVRVINVDVVVTDKKGNRISGLTKDDFTIVENGTQRPITNFFEAAPTALSESLPIEARPTAEQNRRHIVLFIDQVSLDPQNRNRVLRHLRTFLDEAIRANDRVMIATYHRRLDVRLPFTDNHEAVRKTIADIEKEPAAGIDLIHGRRDAELAIRRAELPLQRLLIARTYAIDAEHRLHATVESLLHLMSTVAGVEGKKVLVMVGESLPMQPGREVLALLERFDERRNPFEPRTELDQDVNLDTGQLTLPNKFSSVLDSSFNAKKLIEEVARTANANGITLYPIHAGGIPGGMETTAEYGSDGAELGGLARDTLANSSEAMKYVADLTGGTAIVGAHHYETALSNIHDDMKSYYSLGYKANDEKPGESRRIRVRTKNPDYVVRNRRELIDKSPTQTMSDHAVANLLAVQKANDLGIVLSVDSPVAAGRGNYRVPVKVQIPMQTLTLIPRGDLHLGGFEVFAVLGNAKNDISKVVRLPHRLTFDQMQFDKVKDHYYTYSMDIMMRGGLNNLSVAVVDQVSGTQGFGRASVSAQQ